jgi:hypothetical protein
METRESTELKGPPKVHLREEVADAARFMELQMRGKDPLVRTGDWKHWKQMPLGDLVASLHRNTEELEAMASTGADASKARRKAADLANIASFIGLRLAKGDRIEA